MKAIEKFEHATKDIKGVYGMIACVGCAAFSVGVHPVAVIALVAIATGAYQVAIK